MMPNSLSIAVAVAAAPVFVNRSARKPIGQGLFLSVPRLEHAVRRYALDA